MEADVAFRAMGSDCHVIVVAADCHDATDLAHEAVARIEALESLWSRFRPDSEVSELNRRRGELVDVSPETALLVERAVAAWRFSGGAFDPTVLGAVVRAGYDRSFDELGPTPPPGRSALGLGAGHIEVRGHSVRLPHGVGFDPGGIGKGMAADLVVDGLVAAEARGACVNLGGDVRVRGVGPRRGGGDRDGWTVSVDHPRGGPPLVGLGLRDGAVATSTTLLRRWGPSEAARHHLIDPRSGAPSTTDVELASVVAAEAWVAEALAKAVLLHGSAHPFDNLGGTGAEALVIDENGRMQTSSGLASYTKTSVVAGDAALISTAPT